MYPPEGFQTPWTTIKKGLRCGCDDVDESPIEPSISRLHGNRVTLIKVIFKAIKTQKFAGTEIAVESAIHQNIRTSNETGIRESPKSLSKITRKGGWFADDFTSNHRMNDLRYHQRPIGKQMDCRLRLVIEGPGHARKSNRV